MRAFVFTDAALKGQAGRFVWLAIDTEKEKNAGVQEKYPIDAWPTFLVVDARDERVALRWVGGASVPQLQKLLDDGRAAVTGGAPLQGAEGALARAERAYGERNFKEAAEAYQEALKAAPPDWPHYGHTVESLLFALSQKDDCATSLEIVRAALPRLRETSSAIALADTGLSCALELSESDASRKALVASYEQLGRDVIADPKVVATADDRSSLYGDLADARKAANDPAGAKRIASEWAAFLDAEAGKAGTPEARTVYDSHRLSAYIAMGEPQRAIPMLEASERDFPEDYKPPARLALAYKELGRWDDSLAAADRALVHAYGPRKLRILGTRAEALLGRGDKEGARATLAQALANAEALPPGQRSEPAITAIKKRIAALQ